MKKITDLTINRLVIDPSIMLENQMTDIIQQAKIDVISNSDNQEILQNLYYTFRTYLSDAVVFEIMYSCMEEKDIIKLDREWKIEELLKNKK